MLFAIINVIRLFHCLFWKHYQCNKNVPKHFKQRLNSFLAGFALQIFGHHCGKKKTFGDIDRIHHKVGKILNSTTISSWLAWNKRECFTSRESRNIIRIKKNPIQRLQRTNLFSFHLLRMANRLSSRFIVLCIYSENMIHSPNKQTKKPTNVATRNASSRLPSLLRPQSFTKFNS